MSTAMKQRSSIQISRAHHEILTKICAHGRWNLRAGAEIAIERFAEAQGIRGEAKFQRKARPAA